jgi:hypothetical protein
MIGKTEIIGFMAFAALAPQSAHADTRKLLVGGFEDLVVEGDMKVVLTTGKSSSGTATGDRRILDLLKLDRVAEVMTIRVQKPTNNDASIRIKEPLVVTLSNQNIRNITLLGNASLEVSGINRTGLSRIFINGGGNIKIGNLKIDQLKIGISGNGAIDIGGGTARETDLRIQGSASYKGALLKTRKFTLEQNGNATIAAQVEESAIISNEGAGNINITGNAECLIRRAGSAIIVCPKDKTATKAKNIK